MAHSLHYQPLRRASRNLKQTRMTTPTSEARKIFLCNPRILLSISLLWLPCMFLFRSNSVDTSVSWAKRCMFLKCRRRFEDSVEMEQLKSHLRAGRHTCQLYFTYVSFISHIHVRRLSCVMSLIVLPMLPSPSSAVLLKVPVGLKRGCA